MGNKSSSWKKHVEKEQRRRQETVEKLRQRISDVESEESRFWEQIDRCESALQLADLLRAGKVPVIAALHFYQKRALNAHEQTNCVTEFLLEAESSAIRLDTEYEGVEKDRRPPLFGLPFSVKEHFELRNHISTFGYAHRLAENAVDSDAVMVEMLRRSGAIPFVRTNIPMGMVSFNCSNPIYGVSTHPQNKDRTCGGSSGGEGAILALKAAPFGIGTDGGGSIRLPAAFCGVAGLKPTSTRVSQRGVPANLPGVVVLGITCGPMAPHADTLAEVMRATLSPAAMTMDPYYLCVPFRDEMYASAEPLRIGYYHSDGFFQCTPAVQRAVALAKDTLQAEGHQLVRWDFPDTERALRLFLNMFMPAAGQGMKTLFDKDGNFYEPLLAEHLLLVRLPFWLKHFIGLVLKWSRCPFFARISKALLWMSTDANTLRAVYQECLEFRREITDNWLERSIDAVLTPAYFGAAPSHTLPDRCSLSASYSPVWNALDFAAGTVPVTRVTELDEQQMSGYPSSDVWYRLAKKDQSQGTVGLPVAVQCVALPNHEETCLRLMTLLQNKLPLKHVENSV